jgi:hypothetical protein
MTELCLILPEMASTSKILELTHHDVKEDFTGMQVGSVDVDIPL